MAGDTRGLQVAAIAYTFVVISSIATCLRVYCRGWVSKAFGPDDYLAVIAQIMFIVYSSYSITGVKYGTGRHISDIPTENIPMAMQMWWTCEPTYVLANMAIKASIALFLLRLCVTKLHRAIIWTVFAVTEVYGLFFFLLFILQCRPTSHFWLRYGDNPPAGTCLDATVISDSFYAYSAISCWTDWTYSILPIFLVWNLQMNRRVKWSVVGILAAGAIASSATIVRFPYLNSLTDIDDFLFATTDVAIWSTVETGIGITAAAVATLRPLLRTFFGSGSSAPGHGTSARQWHRTGSQPHKSHYMRSTGVHGDEAFDLCDNTRKQIGVTTVIENGQRNMDVDAEAQKYHSGDSQSEASSNLGRLDDWNTSQSNLAEPAQAARGTQGWNITVKKSIIQTREAV
ncbi:hypothetical protein BD289DRAFT_375944 [Coniella lustricola]|uniref:Rhodopsin domain-containing protein n=1 Tax=Coniella lustricola TaxID=2025994 RepID=A0A2T2ZXJ1_9PEZI|nr:hypothetical protein BD289DRAFT_375944 [Coniella lustricola]